MKLFGANLHIFDNLSDSTIRPLPDTVTRSYDWFDRFRWNFLTSDVENRLVTLNVQASTVHIMSIHIFFKYKFLLFAIWFDFIIRSSTDTVIRSNDGSDMSNRKKISTVVMSSYFCTSLNLLKFFSKWLLEKQICSLKSWPLFNQVQRFVML